MNLLLPLRPSNLEKHPEYRSMNSLKRELIRFLYSINHTELQPQLDQDQTIRLKKALATHLKFQNKISNRAIHKKLNLMNLQLKDAFKNYGNVDLDN